jgi:hypothetical protein
LAGSKAGWDRREIQTRPTPRRPQKEEPPISTRVVKQLVLEFNDPGIENRVTEGKCRRGLK